MTTTLQSNYFTDLIQHQGETLGTKPYIFFEEDTVSFAGFYRATCRVANGFAELGAEPGEGVAILMSNCPEYLFVYHGLVRGGLYGVPVNIALKGEGLEFILTHSDVKYLVVDSDLYPNVAQMADLLGAMKKVIVRRVDGDPLPQGAVDFQTLLDAADVKPEVDIDPQAITTILYTSGTTGFPKGVVTRNRAGSVAQLTMLASIYIKPADILYTALPLFHANALHLTAGFALCMGVPLGIDKKFSASRFWDRTRHYGATQFNALGAMIPILMKQPEKPNDADNPIRLVISAACPANLWRAFEERFGVTIWEFYGAVDGGGVLVFNLGTAPVGSLGKPSPGTEYRLVDDEGKEVQQGETGEFSIKIIDKENQAVEYYKNPEAIAEKVRGGWLYSGDLMYADADGNLYFVDRKTDSMRRRGENISSYEVENVVVKHPAVAACAAFGVPSDLGEDEVMIWVKPTAQGQLDLKDLVRCCAEKMAHFMVPRYIDVVDDIPQTETLRVKKADLKKRGVTGRTWDRAIEMPDLKLK